MYNAFIKQWVCSDMWGPDKWNIGYDIFGVASNHPFKEYKPDKVSASIFFNYLSWLFLRLWPQRVWLSKNFTPRWAAILVMDAIQRGFELNTYFSLLGAYLEKWHMMALFIIVANPLSLWECRSWNTKLAIWYLGWRRNRPSSHARNKQGSEVSIDQKKTFAEPS